MKMGLPPAAPAAVQQAVTGGHTSRRASRDVDPRSVDLGTAVNRMSPGLASASLYGGESGATARLGRTYHRLLREGPGGKIQEIHDYGGEGRGGAGHCQKETGAPWGAWRGRKF